MYSRIIPLYLLFTSVVKPNPMDYSVFQSQNSSERKRLFEEAMQNQTLLSKNLTNALQNQSPLPTKLADEKCHILLTGGIKFYENEYINGNPIKLIQHDPEFQADQQQFQKNPRQAVALILAKFYGAEYDRNNHEMKKLSRPIPPPLHILLTFGKPPLPASRFENWVWFLHTIKRRRGSSEDPRLLFWFKIIQQYESNGVNILMMAKAITLLVERSDKYFYKLKEFTGDEWSLFDRNDMDDLQSNMKSCIIQLFSEKFSFKIGTTTYPMKVGTGDLEFLWGIPVGTFPPMPQVNVKIDYNPSKRK